MNIPALALFTRALRVDARQISTYALRLGLVVVILVTMFSFTFSLRYGLVGSAGLDFFRTIAYVNLCFITLAGLSYFSSAITEEKEEMTLGLLRMTDLNSISILLGKSTSRLLGAVFLMLAQFPFTLLAITLGGISAHQIVAAYCTLLAYTFLLSNIALFCSVVAQRTGFAAALTGFFFIVLIPGPFIVKGMLDVFTSINPGQLPGPVGTVLAAGLDLVRDASAFVRVGEILRTGFSDPMVGYQVITNVALGIIFFLIAWWAFGLFTREQKEESPARGALFRRTSRLRGFGPGRAWPSALMWKDFHFVAGGKLSVVFKFVVLAFTISLPVVFTRYTSARLRSEEFGGWAMGVSLVLLFLDLALSASRIFREERKWKTLPGIMMLPISVSHLALGKVLGSLIGVVPYLVGFSVGVLIAPDVFFDVAGEILSRKEGFVITFYLVCQAISFLYLTAFLSLFIKRGALAVSVGIAYVGNTCLFGILALPFAALGVRNFSFLGVLAALVVLALAVLFHFKIGARLRKLAAES